MPTVHVPFESTPNCFKSRLYEQIVWFKHVSWFKLEGKVQVAKQVLESDCREKRVIVHNNGILNYKKLATCFD